MIYRRLIAFALALLFALSVAGCGGGGTAATTTATTTAATTTVATTAPASQAVATADTTTATTGTTATTTETTTMTASTLANPDATAPVANWDGEVTEIEFMNMSTTWEPVVWGSDPGTARLTEITGVKLNCIVPNGDANQIANVMLAAGDYPETMHMSANAIYNQYIAAGALVPINELAEEYGYPNIMNGTHIPDHVINARTSDDGNMYLVPNWYSEDGFGCTGTALNVRADWYEQFGSPEFNTLEDLYNWFVTIKDANLTTAEGVKVWPMAYAQNDGSYISTIANMWGSQIMGNRYFNEETQRVEFMLRNPTIVKALEFLNQCAAEELMDPTVLTWENETTFMENTTQGKYATVFCHFWSLRDANAILNAQTPGLTYLAVTPPEATPGQKPYFGNWQTPGWGGFMVTKNCKNLEAIARFIDYRVSDAGQILNFYGVEGNTMEFKDGYPYLYPEAYAAKQADFTGYAHSHGVRVWDFMNSQEYNWERHQEDPVSMENRRVANLNTFNSTLQIVILVDPLSEEGILLAELEANIKAQLTSILMESDRSKIPTLVADLLAEYERKGISKLEDEWTRQYLAKLQQ